MSVRFRFKLNLEGDTRLLRVYSKKWGALLGYAFKVPRKREDYLKMAKVSKELDRGFKLSDVLEKIPKDNPDGLRILTDCQALFDKAPYDMRVFLLSSVGYETSS